jgi:hypothetical protein
MSSFESVPIEPPSSSPGLRPARPRGSERLSATTGTVLIGYALLFVTGQAGDGTGWALALLGFAFGHWVAPILALVAATLAITSRRRRSPESLALALILATAVLGFDAFLMTSHDFRPRGPLG